VPLTRRRHGRITNSHQELVRALQRDKGHLRQSLRLLAGRGWLVMGRSSGGQAAFLRLTPEDRNGPRSLQEVVSKWQASRNKELLCMS
jgi:hypothetical protein